MEAILKVAANAPNPDYNVENFTYHKEDDCYICPQGNKLNTNGNWYKSKTYRFKRYLSKSCKTCLVKSECSKSKYGKANQRSEYQEYIDNNKKRIEQNKDYYRKRQTIVEHPYSTIERQWEFSYIMTKKYVKKAESDIGLIFTAYNLRRLINIIGIETLQSYLGEALLQLFDRILLLKLKDFKPFYFLRAFKQYFFKHFIDRISITQILTFNQI